MGGMDLKAAYLFMLNKGGWSEKKIQDYMKAAGHSQDEIQDLLKD